jgi:Fur family ferric uptake transcriptional regulator
MTRARKAIAAVLAAAEEPLSAAQVRDRLDPSCCDQATVYRTLDHLEQEAMAESFVLRCTEHGTQRYFVSTSRPHRHWFHCESCHRFIDIGMCGLGAVTVEIEREHSLEIRRHSMYFSGLCGACRYGSP